jgi:hypothetical protein
MNKNMNFKPSKYRNNKINGYDSKKEYNRSNVLKLLEKNGNISGLKEQVSFELAPAVYIPGIDKKQVCVHRKLVYIADFVYYQDYKLIVEDVKGFRTKEYTKKKNLMKKIHGIEIKET